MENTIKLTSRDSNPEMKDFILDTNFIKFGFDLQEQHFGKSHEAYLIGITDMFGNLTFVNVAWDIEQANNMVQIYKQINEQVFICNINGDYLIF